MDNIKIQLDIIIETLQKKSKTLEEILNYTKEQTTLLEQEEFNLDDFNKTIDEKEARINKVMELDEGFKSIYEKVRLYLEPNKELYKDKISIMKQNVVEIGNLNVAIKVQEERNKLQFSNKIKEEKTKIKEFRKSKQTVANYYSNINKQRSTEQSHFFDSKK